MRRVSGRIALMLGIVVVTVVVAAAFGTGGSARWTEEQVRADLRGYLEDVRGAELVRYDVHDSLGQPMGPGAIIAAPGAEFATVYFVYVEAGNTFDVHLATSPDLVSWTWRARLAVGASQPTIERATDGGYVVGWEKEPPNHLQFVWYATWTDLLEARSSKLLDVPMTLSDCAEGTPSLYAASSTALDVGFHFYDRCDVDRPARGQTDWQTWHAAPRPAYEAAFRKQGAGGGVGDRDTFRFRGRDFTVQEVQRDNGVWETFRIHLYDDAAGTAEPLDIRTAAGCTALSNPMVELLELRGRQMLVSTLFALGEGGVACESGGMLYAHEIG